MGFFYVFLIIVYNYFRVFLSFQIHIYNKLLATGCHLYTMYVTPLKMGNMVTEQNYDFFIMILNHQCRFIIHSFKIFQCEAVHRVGVGSYQTFFYQTSLLFKN